MNEQESTTTDAPAAPPPSDYVSLTSFDELPLSEPTRRSIAEKGYTKPTPVQAAVLKPILAGKDTIVRSKTGTGKTAAFGIPVVERIDPELMAVQSIVLCNTRELALQVATEIAELGKYKGVKVVAIYGGTSMEAQLKALREGATIVVGTPGRVIDLIERRTLQLGQVKIAVLDEADEMLGVGFFEDVMTILRACPRGHQTLLFSATLSPDIERLIKTHLKDPETILLSGDTYSVEGIRNIRYFARDEYPKPRNLMYMLQLENPESAIIFCNTRDDVNLICTVLNRNGYDADKLSGELEQSARERVMARIKRGEVRFMVATDIAARGIDISDLTHVINYSLPEDASVYMHRVGRTGRIGKTGTALSLIRGTELVTMTILEKKYGIKFEEKKLPTPEEAHRIWADVHIKELRAAIGNTLYDAFVPLAQDLKTHESGDLLLAFALKYFFTHHRMEKAQALAAAEELKNKHLGKPVTPDAIPAIAELRHAKDAELRKRHDEKRSERAKPVFDKPAEAAQAPGNTEEKSTEPVRRNRLYVSLGESSGLDEAGVRAAIVALSGAPADAIRTVEMKQSHSYVEVADEAVDAFLAGNGKPHGEKTMTIEVARPPTRRRRR